MPKTKSGGFIIDDEVIVAKDVKDWAKQMLAKAGLNPEDFDSEDEEEEDQKILD